LKSSRELRLLSSQNLQVGGLRVAHKLSGAINCALQDGNLLYADIGLAASRASSCYGGINLASGLQ
jgi:hypothetical protein